MGGPGHPKPPAGTLLWRGKGCRYCFNTGYRGRTVVSELLVVDEGIRSAIIRGAHSVGAARHGGGARHDPHVLGRH